MSVISLHCTPETYTVLCVSNISIELEGEKNKDTNIPLGNSCDAGSPKEEECLSGAEKYSVYYL